ncbi:alpha/beta fold hydrolase [Streptomyces sp. NPDC005876]|uniref:alpha/beta fold hydrolase n=1 Tax=Streptomyces sp. NPDC005876 TaxID=3157076 RepID=UPI0033F86944
MTAASSSIQERRTEVERRATVYWEAGAGPDLLLLHGDAGSPLDWVTVMPRLATTHHVVALDLPGFGRTPPLDEPSPERYAAFVAAFTEVLGLRHYSLIGHSFGGMIAVYVARAAHGNVDRLVLVAPGGLGRAVNPAQILTVFPVLRRAAFAISLLPGFPVINTLLSALGTTYRPWNIPPRWYAKHLERARNPQFVGTSLAVVAHALTPFGQRYDLRPELPRLHMPTLVVWGAGDLLVPAWQAAAASLLPQGARRLLAAGHSPQLDVADDFLEAVRPFLAGDHQRT